MAKNPDSKTFVDKWFSSKSILSYEVLYPNKFSPECPWSSRQCNLPPRFPWNLPKEEIEFPVNDPANIQDHEVSTEIIDQLNSLLGSNKRIEIPITHLSHHVHEKEAEIIIEDKPYVFQPVEKCARYKGVAVPGNNVSFAYDLKTSEATAMDSPLFPGYLSWWGLNTNTEHWHESGSWKAEIIRSLDEKEVYTPDYLQGVVCSQDGSNRFTATIEDMMKNYRESRTDCEGEQKNIYLKKGGTLRYRYKIGYVVFVCTAKDLEEESIAAMPSMYEPDDLVMNENGEEEAEYRHFKHSGYIDKDGMIIDETKHPFFVSEYPIKADYKNNKADYKKLDCPIRYSWDCMQFAYYFPMKGQHLTCEGVTHIKKDKVKHTPGMCHYRVEGIKECPDCTK